LQLRFTFFFFLFFSIAFLDFHSNVDQFTFSKFEIKRERKENVTFAEALLSVEVERTCGARSATQGGIDIEEMGEASKGGCPGTIKRTFQIKDGEILAVDYGLKNQRLKEMDENDQSLIVSWDFFKQRKESWPKGWDQEMWQPEKKEEKDQSGKVKEKGKAKAKGMETETEMETEWRWRQRWTPKRR